MKIRQWGLLLAATAVIFVMLSQPGEAHRRRSTDRLIIPHWVRYPFEFQLCGIALGTRSVDRDLVNKVERYSLFFVHGNPTAVVLPGGGTVTAAQAPPGSGVPFLESGATAPWMSAVSITIPPGHVQWLFRRDEFAMGFVVDPLGFVTAITVSGDLCPIASTQMADPYHGIQLGNDFRKVLFRYGYPDQITVFAAGGGGGGGAAGAPGAIGPGGDFMGPGGPMGGAMGQAMGQLDRGIATRQLEELNQALATTWRPQLETRASARQSGSAKTSSGAGRSKSIPPLPPARMEVRTSGQRGPMMAPGGGGGAMGMMGMMGGGPPGMGPMGSAMSGAGPGGGGAGAPGIGGGAQGPGAIGSAGGNALFATYQLDYRDTYNVIFTIRNNRVVRIFIWGDPDYFTDRQRLQMRRRF